MEIIQQLSNFEVIVLELEINYFPNLIKANFIKKLIKINKKIF